VGFSSLILVNLAVLGVLRVTNLVRLDRKYHQLESINATGAVYCDIDVKMADGGYSL
jgi:hypothetical protein